jgi:hypothetical protein
VCALYASEWSVRCVLAWWYIIQYTGSLMVIALRNVTSLLERMGAAQ